MTRASEPSCKLAPVAGERIPAELVELAGLTDRQREALELWNPDPDKTSGGYRTVALAMGCSMSTVRQHIAAGLAKLERVLDEPAA